MFERFPNLKFVMTEMGCAWMPPMLQQLDAMLDGDPQDRSHRRDRATTDEHVLPRVGDRVLPPQLLDRCRASPGPPTIAAREYDSALDRFMWGSDYPHDEGTGPFTREHLRQLIHGIPEDEIRRLLAGNAAALYDFDLDALAPLAAKVGPTVAEIDEPLTELPEDPNEALLRVASGAR